MNSVIAHLTYLTVSIAIVIWVVRSLNRNSPVLLAAQYDPEQPVSQSLTSMLVTSFYLLAIGLTAMNGRQTADVEIATSIELTCTQIGLVIIGLAVAYFVILGVVIAIRRGFEREPKAPPPLPGG